MCSCAWRRSSSAHDERDVRRVVQRPVVERVAVHRRPVAVAVEVRRENDRLARLRRIGPGKDADDVRRPQRPPGRGERRPQAVAHVERGQRAPGTTRGDKRIRVLRAPGEHRPERLGAQREGDEPGARRLRRGGRGGRCRQRRRRRRPAGEGDTARVRRRPARRLHGEARVGDGEHTSRPRLLERGAPLRVGRQPGASSRVADHQLPAHVALWAAQRVGSAIAAVGERAVERRRRGLRAKGHVVQEPEGPPSDVEVRASDGDLLHRYPLVPRPLVAERLHPGRSEPPGDVGRGVLVPARPGVAPLQRVRGEHARHVPPRARVGVRRNVGEGLRRLQERENGECDGEHGGTWEIGAGRTRGRSSAVQARYTGRRPRIRQGRAKDGTVHAASASTRCPCVGGDRGAWRVAREAARAGAGRRIVKAIRS